MNEEELNALGYAKVFDYTSFSHENNVNVIPEDSFKKLVRDTFKVITDVLRETYGPYGSDIMISDQNETTTTKDGYNIFNAIGFSHQYKQKVYLAIKKIIDRVNHNVGDGTTSCILLAEKIFNRVAPLLKTPDDKRNIKKVLDMIEDSLQMVDDTNDIVKPLTESSLKNLIMLASNYDEKLTDTLIQALEPEVDLDGNIKSMRNVIPDTSTTYETSANVSYEIDYLPGDYRCRVDMNNNDIALVFSVPSKVKVVVYDNVFGEPEWHNLMEEYDKDTPTLVVARGFSHVFMDNVYVRYLKQRQMANVGPSIFICQMRGDFVQDELHDFAAVVGTDVRTAHSSTVNHDELPWAVVEVYKYNCLCVHDASMPADYVHDLEIEYESEKSYVRKTILKDRIRALSLQQKDSIVSVKAGTSLELKMTADKIDDCVAIAKSAFDHGIVPNLLFYGNDRIDQMLSAVSEKFASFGTGVISAIEEAIADLFLDIYESKHGKILVSDETNEIAQLMLDFYNNNDGDASFNIITDELVRMETLPTSAQYDIEVLVAAISIVKYLLASRALIFDACLMPAQGDQGRYVRTDEM